MRQYVFGIACIAGLVLASLLLPGINRQREEFQLTANPVLENAPPELVFATTALGGFRGIIVDVLWLRAIELQQESKFFELVQLFDWIGKLEPRCVPVWVYSAWNMAYNISVELPNAPERWLWIRQGMRRLLDHGIRYNQRASELYRELAWIYSHKIGKNIDDFHQYFKNAVAIEIEDVMGRGPAIDLEPFVKAAGSREELVQRCDAGPLLDALKAAAYAPERQPLEVLRALDGGDAAVKSIFDAPEHAVARDETVMFLRTKALREHLRLDPVEMAKLAEEYGPMDWRLPDPHALYWAGKANEYATDEDFAVNYDRIQYEALKRLYMHGDLYFERGRTVHDSYYMTSANWRFLDRANKMYVEFVQKHEPHTAGSITGAHRSFLEEAIVLLFICSQTEKSIDYFNEMIRRYPNERYRVPYEEFISKTLMTDLLDLSQEQAKTAIDGLLFQSFRWWAGGDDERSGRLLRLALTVWQRYQKDSDVAIKRMGLPPFKVLKKDAKERALRILPPTLRQRLEDRLAPRDDPGETEDRGGTVEGRPAGATEGEEADGAARD